MERRAASIIRHRERRKSGRYPAPPERHPCDRIENLASHTPVINNAEPAPTDGLSEEEKLALEIIRLRHHGQHRRMRSGFDRKHEPDRSKVAFKCSYLRAASSNLPTQLREQTNQNENRSQSRTDRHRCCDTRGINRTPHWNTAATTQNHFVGKPHRLPRERAGEYERDFRCVTNQA